MFGEYEVPLAFNAIGTIAMLLLSGVTVWYFLNRSKPSQDLNLPHTSENNMAKLERVATLDKMLSAGLIDETEYAKYLASEAKRN